MGCKWFGTIYTLNQKLHKNKEHACLAHQRYTSTDVVSEYSDQGGVIVEELL